MLKEFGATLIKRGYSICAITPREKRPVGKDWNHNPLTVTECEAEFAFGFNLADHGIGIICGTDENPVMGLDFDVKDPELADTIHKGVEKILGCSPAFRQGEPPKFLIPAKGKSIARNFKLYKGGKDAGFDILTGKSARQFVAMGIHPSGIEYSWHGYQDASGCPIPPYDSLPTVSEEQLEQIKALVFSTLTDAGYAERAEGQVLSSDAELDRLLTPRLPKLKLTLAQAEKYIVEAIDGSTRDPWLHVGMALNHQFGDTELADDALLLWDKWSQTQPKYPGFEGVKKEWDSFDPKRRDAKTMRWVIAQWRLQRDPHAADMTEVGRARRFVEEYRDEFRYCLDTERWYIWGGCHWRLASDKELMPYVQLILGDLLIADIRDSKFDEKKEKAAWAFYARCQTKRAITSVLGLLSGQEEFFCRLSDFDADVRYLGVANGDVDLETGALLPPDPKRMITRYTSARYDPIATCPTWEKALSDDFFGNAEMIQFMRLGMGYSLTGTAREQVFFILIGDGANGKSALINTLYYVLGGHAGTLPPEAVTVKGRANQSSASGPRPEIAGLRGKRFVKIEETEANAKFREAPTKTYSSQGQVQGRDLFQKAGDETNINVTWVLFMATNHTPRVMGCEAGIWRRLLKVDFKRNFETDPTVKRDKDLEVKLRAERDGILTWLVRAEVDYRKYGLKVPKCVEDSVKEYRKSQDSFGEFLEAECDSSDPEASVTIQGLFDAWKRWYDGSFTDRDYGTKQMLTERLLKTNRITKRIIRKDGRKQWCYVGIRLRDDELDFPSANAEVEDLF